MELTAKRDKALQEAVEDHSARLTSIIRGMVRDQVEAEDVLQEVFTEFIEAYDIGFAFEKIGAWLVTVAKNKVLDRFRRKKTRSEYIDNQSQIEPEAADELNRILIRNEILAGLELLPPEQRQVFIMYELEGKSFKEIASETKVPIGTLLARKKYAVDFLRDYLKETYDEYE